MTGRCVVASMRRPIAALFVMSTALAWVSLGGGSPAGASEPINGGGSTWSAVAIAAWASDVAEQGLTVNYQDLGSTAGRQGYTAGTFDFAVSEIPFQAQYCTNPADPNTCYDELTQPGLLARPYVYMPIVAGGTSLLYNIPINGRQFTHLNLSPVALTKIFTGEITNWDNPMIAAENPGVRFPNLAIQPVVRSDGAGTSYQFTAFMKYEDPSDWQAFCERAGIHQNPCPPTSQFPYSALPNSEAEDGSDGIADWVSEPYNPGSIGYAEAAYGLQDGIPLVSLQNRAGSYVQPTAKAVAVALTGAIINSDNTQNLTGVYSNPDPRAYPMSSYSYMIVPTTDAPPMDTSKGATLGHFILYFLCQGQQQAAPLGYSPLPPNLVQIGFNAEQRIPGAPRPPPIRTCNNPTITGGFLNGIGTPVVAGHGGRAVSGSTSGGSGTRTSEVTGRSVQSHAGSSTTVAAKTSHAQSFNSQNSRAAVELATSSPQLFGKAFRPMSEGLLALVIAITIAILVAPRAVGNFGWLGRLRRPKSRDSG
jgi:phosphate transport system substrate-binding protein